MLEVSLGVSTVGQADTPAQVHLSVVSVQQVDTQGLVPSTALRVLQVATAPLVVPRASVPVLVLWDDTQRPGQLLDLVQRTVLLVLWACT